MNDPHVVHLEYRIVCDLERIDWSAAKTAVFEEEDFRGEVVDQRVLFKFKTHYASENDARESLRSFIQNWEFEVGLERGPRAFTLCFAKSHIIDRNPSNGVMPITLSLATGSPEAKIDLIIQPKRYPSPPSLNKIKRTPDVDSMYDRYLGYRDGKEPLPAMAYFCLTVLEWMAGGSGSRKDRREAIAKKFGIARDVLDKVGELSSEGGGPVARKEEGRNRPYAPNDTEFLNIAIQCMIQRAAEVAQDDAKREQITLDTIKSKG